MSTSACDIVKIIETESDNPKTMGNTKPRVIIVVEGGMCQEIESSEPIDYDVLDHDTYKNCTSNKDTSFHDTECEEHTKEDFAYYRGLIEEANEIKKRTLAHASNPSQHKGQKIA